MNWEDMVNKVCVSGRPEQVKGLALDWGAVFSNASSVAQNLRDGIKDLEGKWKGPAADDYRAKIESIAKTIDQIHEDHRGIITMLQSTGDALAKGQTDMPVPDYMLDEVQGRRAQLDAANQAGARAMMSALGGPGAIGPALLLPNSFMKPLADSFVGNWGRDLFGHFQAWWDDWNGKMTNEARQVYDGVDRSYGSADVTTPNPTASSGSHDSSGKSPTFGNGPGAGPTGGVPGAGGAGMHPSTAGLNPNTHGFHNPGLGSGAGSHLPSTGSVPSPGIGSGSGLGSGYDPSKTSLAGAGGGGLSGLGSGTGGLGGLGAGAGGLGAGAGGLGAGTSGLGAGRPVSPPAMSSMGMGGMGAGAGRGGAGRSGAGRTGAVGGGGHGGAHAPDDERGTWLTEDEDVWGGDNIAPPGVLG
jgi:uncharacterized protein YukE